MLLGRGALGRADPVSTCRSGHRRDRHARGVLRPPVQALKASGRRPIETVCGAPPPSARPFSSRSPSSAAARAVAARPPRRSTGCRRPRRHGRMRRSGSSRPPASSAATPAGFRPSDPLTRGELADALAAWGKPATVPADPAKLVTMSELDAQLVDALGLTPAARRIRLAAGDGQLAPTSRLGTETVARLLGLRLDHPQGQDELELLPTQPATRAEAAYSFARALSLTQGQLTWVDQLSYDVLAARARRLAADGADPRAQVRRLPVRVVGHLGVDAEAVERDGAGRLGHRAGRLRLLRVRLARLQDEAVPRCADARRHPQGEDDLRDERRGREARADRPPAACSPATSSSSARRGRSRPPTEVGHMGIYVGNGWFVHSSSAGVTLQPLQGWYAKTFAWARRPLLEAGLTASTLRPSP